MVIFHGYVSLPEGSLFEKKPNVFENQQSMGISGSDLLEVPTIYKAYVRDYSKQNMALYGTVPPF